MLASKKKVTRTREILQKKPQNLKQFFYNSIYNKEILKVLEEIESYNNTLTEIDGLIKNHMIYQASLNLEKLNASLEKMNEKFIKTANLKYILETEKQRKNELYVIIQNFIKNFLFCFEKPLIYQISLSKDDKTNFFTLERVNLKKGETMINPNQMENNLNNFLIKEFDVNLHDYAQMESKYLEFKNAFCTSKISKSKLKIKKAELIEQLLETFKLKNYISKLFNTFKLLQCYIFRFACRFRRLSKGFNFHQVPN